MLFPLNSIKVASIGPELTSNIAGKSEDGKGAARIPAHSPHSPQGSVDGPGDDADLAEVCQRWAGLSVAQRAGGTSDHSRVRYQSGSMQAGQLARFTLPGGRDSLPRPPGDGPIFLE